MENISDKVYIQEIFSSFQGEGAAIAGSCYGLRQIFVRFSGCPLAMGAHGTNGCVWCDSPKSQKYGVKKCKIETAPGSQEFKSVDNPLAAKEVVKIIKGLITPDLHSISLTGGEPLYQESQIAELLALLKKEGFKVYLETAFTENFSLLSKLAQFIDYACVDIKDRSAKASNKWEELVEIEVKMCDTLKKRGVKTFAKVVISQNSKAEDFHYISKRCGEFGIPLAIQPVTPLKGLGIEPPTWDQITEFSSIAAEYLPADKVGISVQVHKLINIM